MFPARAWIPNLVSAAAIAAGLGAIVVAERGELDLAVHLVFASILLDMVDGRIARLLNATSAFGQQVDSLADVLNFGAVPAFLVYRAVLQEVGWLGFWVAVLYLLSGVYRLARYNVLSDAHVKSRTTLGLPIPIAASFMMVLVLMRAEFQPLSAGLVVLMVAALMGSRLRLPTITGANWTAALLMLCLVNFLWVVYWPNWYTVGWWMSWMVLTFVVATIRDHRAGVAKARAASVGAIGENE